MHVTSKCIYVVVRRTWSALWSLPSGIKIVINLGRLVGCRMLDLPHFKSSAEWCGITMLEWNQLRDLSTKHHPKIAFVFARSMTKKQHVAELVRCLHMRSTRATVLILLIVSLILWRRVMLQYVGVFWTDQGVVDCSTTSLVDALTCYPRGRRQGLPFLFIHFTLRSAPKGKISKFLRF